jgi:hypothetical protein
MIGWLTLPVASLPHQVIRFLRVLSNYPTFGVTPPPIGIYRGPTGRRALNYSGSTALVAAEPGKPNLPAPPETTVGSGLEGKSLGNVSRGDRIRTCDLLNPIQTR